MTHSDWKKYVLTGAIALIASCAALAQVNSTTPSTTPGATPGPAPGTTPDAMPAPGGSASTPNYDNMEPPAAGAPASDAMGEPTTTKTRHKHHRHVKKGAATTPESMRRPADVDKGTGNSNYPPATGASSSMP